MFLSSSSTRPHLILSLLPFSDLMHARLLVYSNISENLPIMSPNQTKPIINHQPLSESPHRTCLCFWNTLTFTCACLFGWPAWGFKMHNTQVLVIDNELVEQRTKKLASILMHVCTNFFKYMTLPSYWKVFFNFFYKLPTTLLKLKNMKMILCSFGQLKYIKISILLFKMKINYNLKSNTYFI